MKKNETAKRETMTFPELWRDLRLDEADDVRRSIKEGLRKTTATFWRWYTGAAEPETYAERMYFAKIINETLGINTDADILFPPKK
ncbi:MAG: hypothetical protein K2J62_05640 [Bacteroidales bacterium]|nr:hypothetical protein [Bacteroidales bacterium]